VLRAILSDVHANLEALEACLAHARSRGATGHAFLGDLVGYGADAAAVVERVMQLASDGAVTIKGNHDAAIEKRDSYFNHDAHAALDWAAKTLSDAQKRFLAGLPLVAETPSACFVHASARSPAHWTYVDSPGAAEICTRAAVAAVTFCGHVHDQKLYFGQPDGHMTTFTPVAGVNIPVKGRRRWVAIVGSVGQPRDRNPAAGYALFDDETRELTFFRVPYDHHAAARKVREAGLPGSLAWRIEAGI
jgi:diadenosine tetraphosphatase ApaH/serine/threonine PP2A family protein phosphatase